MNNTIVQKYGGSSVATPEKIKSIANYLKDLKKEHKNIVVVLSAMGKTTNNLIELAGQFSPTPNKRDLDFLLSTGEMQTVSLMSIALNEIGVKSVALTGMQAGIKTNNNHSLAFIKKIDINKINKYLNEDNIVLVAGFQGVSEGEEITTLGRGGSDTTAVALAAMLNCPCEIYTDVDAVKTVDPKLYPNAKALHKISYEEMMEMAVNGAKVLEPRSVELASKYNVDLYLGKTLNLDKQAGTKVESGNFEDMFIKSISIKENYNYINVTASKNEANSIIEAISKTNLNFEMLNINSLYDELNLSFAIPSDKVGEFKRRITNYNISSIVISDPVVKLTIVGMGIATHTDILKCILELLAANSIYPSNLIVSEISISFTILGKDTPQAIKIISSEYNL